MAEGSVEIANGALIKLGANPILSLDDAVKEARIAKVRYDVCRKSVLRMHPWNFAKKRAVLAATTETVEFGYTYKFNLPGDCIRVLDVEDNDDFMVEGRAIFTDDSTVNLTYLGDITEASLFDPLFSEALSAYMAWIS